MPLKKLWNAITGRSSTETRATSDSPRDTPLGSSDDAVGSAGNPAVVKANAPTEKSVGSRRGGAKKAAAKRAKSQSKRSESVTEAGKSIPIAKPAAAKPRAKVSRRDPLIKMLSVEEMQSPSTVLEIGAGDGSRAIKVCTVLEETIETVRYVAVDQFEMAGGRTSLMDFHRALRGAGIRPQVFPEPIVSGLTRVAHTIGACDLILVSEQVSDEDLAQMGPQLARIAHPQTQVLVERSGVWNVHTLARVDLRRAA